MYLAAVKSNGYALRVIPEHKRSYEICLVAVKKNWKALKHVPVDKRTDEICLAAFEQDACALRKIPNKKPDFCLRLLKQNALAFHSFQLKENDYIKMNQVVEVSLNQIDKRNKIRKRLAGLKPKGDYYIKSIRGDQYSYFNFFVEELLDPNKKFPKRKGLKNPPLLSREMVYFHVQGILLFIP